MNGVIYARYSSDNQREESIDGQLRECKAFAEKNDIRIIDSYIDRALSAKTDNRPAFQQMINDSSKGLFDVIIVWKLDRFARNRYDSAHYKAQLRKNGVKVISATEAISEGAEGVLLESVLEGMAEYYSKELAEKTLRGMTDNALQCKSNGGQLLIGYKTDSELHYQIDTEMAPIVVEAFNLYAEGATMKEIVDIFNSRGIRTKRGKPITINAITNMLHNRKYIGEYKFKDIVIPNGIPAIISEELFDKVQVKMSTNKKAPARHKTDDEYLLTTKLYCGKCMSFMVGESGRAKGNRYSYYKCVNAKRTKSCDKKAVKKDWIENIVVKQVMDTIMDDDLIERIIDSILKTLESENTTVPILKKELSETEKSIKNMINAIEQGIITKSTKQRLDELEKRKEELEIQIAAENIKQPILTREQLVFWFHKFRKFDFHKLEYRRRLIDSFVNAVILYDDKIEFHFNYKDGAKELSFDELNNVSDLSSLTPP